MAFDNVAQVIAAGFRRGQLALINDDNYPMGLTGTLAAGEMVGLTHLGGVRTANLSIPEATRVVVTGDERAIGAFLFPPDQLPVFDIEVAIADFDIAAAFEGVKVHDLESWSIHAMQGREIDYKRGMIMLSTRAQSQASGSDGLTGWYHLLCPQVEIAYLGPGALNQRDERVFNFRVSVSPATMYPWGDAFTIPNEGVTEASILELTSANQLSMHTAEGDTVFTDIILDHTPIDDDPAFTHHDVYRDGVTEVLTSITPATKTCVLGTNLDADEVAVVVYEHVVVN